MAFFDFFEKAVGPPSQCPRMILTIHFLLDLVLQNLDRIVFLFRLRTFQELFSIESWLLFYLQACRYYQDQANVLYLG